MRAIEKSRILLVFGSVLACGGESDEGRSSGVVDTGLPEDQVLSDVTPAEYAQACEAGKRSVTERLNPETLTPRACAAFGAAFSDTADACEPFAEECIGSVEDGTNPLISAEDLDLSDNIQCDGAAPDLQECGVTVGQLETCLSDTITGFEATFASYGCANASNISLADLAALMDVQNMPGPPSCAALEEQCPGVDLLGQPQ